MTSEVESPPRPLAGRTALVTGAGRGIGRAVSLELGRMGARVVAVGRNEENLRETCAALRAAGAEAEPIAADIRTDAFLAELRAAAGEVDVVVNNAAAFARYASLEDVDLGEVEEVLDTIVRAPLRILREVLPGMKRRGFGRIVNVGSVAAGTGALGQVAYAAAKSALVGMTRSVAAEAADSGVTCNLVEPGLIATERIAENVADIWQQRILANTAMGRAGTPQEVAAVIGFLASPAASYVTGAVIPVSGGLGIGLYARDV